MPFGHIALVRSKSIEQALLIARSLAASNLAFLIRPGSIQKPLSKSSTVFVVTLEGLRLNLFVAELIKWK
jgi:hypothetical protein